MRRHVIALSAAVALVGGFAPAAPAAPPRGTAPDLAPSGVPVRPGPYVVEQSDGSTLTIHGRGEGVNHAFVTDDGYTVVRDDSGDWVYADERNGELAATDAPAQGAPPAGVSRGEQPAVRPTFPPAPAPNAARTGSEPLVVILAESSNQTSIAKGAGDTNAHTRAYWAGQVFGATNSVAAYYSDMSGGAYSITPATENDAGGVTSGVANDGIIGWVNTGVAHPNVDFGGPSNAAVGAAITAASPYIDYAAYDTDADGVVEPHELHILIVFAGYEGAYGLSDCGNRIWGHRWSLFDASAVTSDGVLVGSGPDGGYMTFGEWHCDQGTVADPGHAATIGIMAHEFGHDISLPDLYDTDQSSFGIGAWGLMSGGTWLGASTGVPNDGSTPSGLSAWSRWQQRWITPTPVLGTTSANVRTTSKPNGRAYVLGTNTDGPDWTFSTYAAGEYFLVENRQQVNWDTYLPGCGILIWHVDEAFLSNANDDRRLVDLEGGNEGGSNAINAYNSPFFDGAGGSTLFDASTVPASNWHRAPSGVTVDVTSDCADVMTAQLTAPATGPVNDHLADAIDLTDIPMPGTTTGTNLHATDQPGEPQAGITPATEPDDRTTRRSVWWTWTAPADGVVVFDTAGSDFDTTLSVYRGTSIANLVEVAANDDDAGTTTSRVVAHVTEGTTYRVNVRGWDGLVGNIQLNWTIPTVTLTGMVVDEADGTADVTLSLDMPAGGGESVLLAPLPDSDAVVPEDALMPSVPIVFAPGETEITVPVVIATDTLREVDEDLVIRATEPSGLLVGDDATITILDDDRRSVQTLAGADRVETGVLASFDTWDDAGGVGRTAGAAVVASARSFPDALVGTPLAVDRRAPMLLTEPGELHPMVATELQRILEPGMTVYVLGGTAAVDPAVADAIDALGFDVVRLFGLNRHETAVAVADELGDVDHVLVATGQNFPDALAAGAAAASVDGAVLLTADDVMPAVTADALAARPAATTWAVGGQAARALPTATPLVGANRYATATTTAQALVPGATFVGMASGQNFPDALSGGVHTAVRGGALILTHPDTLPVATRDHLVATEPWNVQVYGGLGAVGQAVRDAIQTLLDAMEG